MSFAYRGITHCTKCGNPLSMDEFYLCSYCKEEENKKIEEERFNEAVAKRVQIELAKIQKKIETITITDLYGTVVCYTGYWENGVFHRTE